MSNSTSPRAMCAPLVELAGLDRGAPSCERCSRREDIVTRARCANAYGLVESPGSGEREVDHNVVLLTRLSLRSFGVSTPLRRR
jgi:hypothetical protein